MGTRFCEITENAAERKVSASIEGKSKSSDRRHLPDAVRLSVRLDNELSEALSRRCEKSGRTPSEVVRDALRRELESQQKSTPESSGVAVPATGPPVTYEFPSELQCLLLQLRTFGTTVWTERRQRFLTVLALSEIARRASRSPEDLTVCTELLHLAKRFAWVRGD